MACPPSAGVGNSADLPGKEPSSANTGPRKSFHFSYRGVRMDVDQDAGTGGGFEVDMTGDLVWPTALAFCKYLCEHAQLLAGRRVLDLGAGTGLVGLIAARLGAQVTLTDVPRVLPLLSHNVAAATAASTGDASSSIEAVARPLFWGDREAIASLLADRGPFDVILCCEVVYQQPDYVLEALRHTLQELLAKPVEDAGRPSQQAAPPMIIFAYQQRDGSEVTDSYFFEGLLKDGFEPDSSVSLSVWDQLWDDSDCRWVRIYKRRLGA